MQTYPDELRGVIADHFNDVSKTASLRPANALGAILRREGLNEDQWRRVLLSIEFPAEAEQKRLLSPGKGGVVECLEEVQHQMLRAGMLKRSTDVRTLVSTEFVTGGAP